MENGNDTYQKIKEQVLNAIEEKKETNAIRVEELEKLKEEKQKELDRHKDTGYSDALEFKKQLVIEHYNDLILKKEIEIQTNDLYSNRIRTFLHFMYFKFNENKEEVVGAIKELEDNIEKELVTFYNNQIKIIKQKNLIYKIEKLYIEAIRKSDSNIEYENIVSDLEINDELAKQEKLERDRKIAEDEFGGVNIQISTDVIDSINILDEDIVNFAKAICPNFKNRILAGYERSYNI